MGSGSGMGSLLTPLISNVNNFPMFLYYINLRKPLIVQEYTNKYLKNVTIRHPEPLRKSSVWPCSFDASA